MNTAKQGLNLFLRSKNMRNKSKTSNSQNGNKFLHHLELGIQSIIDNVWADSYIGDRDLARSHLKRHIRLMLHTRLDGIVDKLIP